MATPIFPASATALRIDGVHMHGHILTTGRYVGLEPQGDDGVPFEHKMKRLDSELRDL